MPSLRSVALASLDASKENLLLFAALPSQAYIVLLLELLNSYRRFGLRFVQYAYITNEFGLTDTEAGSLLGAKATLDTVFGFVGSLLTDSIGVRKTAVGALAMGVVGRLLLTVGTTRAPLFAAYLFFSPLGDALLSVGIYKVRRCWRRCEVAFCFTSAHAQRRHAALGVPPPPRRGKPSGRCSSPLLVTPIFAVSDPRACLRIAMVAANANARWRSRSSRRRACARSRSR